MNTSAQTILSMLPADVRQLGHTRYRQFKDYRRLQNSEHSIVSFAKSGRTWLRILIARMYQQQFLRSESGHLDFERLARIDSRIPVINFTHGSYLGPPRELAKTQGFRKQSSWIMLVRNPCDVCVSCFFHIRNRTDLHKQITKGFPFSLEPEQMFQFCVGSRWSVGAIANFMNDWALALDQSKRSFIVRYEDLHTDPHTALRNIAETLSLKCSDEVIAEAIEFASFENLKRKEQQNFFQDKRMRPGNKEDNNSYKVRRGKVGGYHNYFTQAQTTELEQIVRSTLDARFGY